jgi:hypothetical protein
MDRRIGGRPGAMVWSAWNIVVETRFVSETGRRFGARRTIVR